MRTKSLWMVGVGCVCAALTFGQSTGSIAGTISDESGAVVPSAPVTATNTQTGVASSATSLSDGQYLFGSLPVGTYVTSVEVPGFRKFTSSPIEVHVGDRLTLNIKLQVGATNEQVTITAEAPLLRTEDAQVGEVVNNNFIRNIPINADRNIEPLPCVKLSET